LLAVQDSTCTPTTLLALHISYVIANRQEKESPQVFSERLETLAASIRYERFCSLLYMQASYASPQDGLNSPQPLANFYAGDRSELAGMDKLNLTQRSVLFKLALWKLLASRLSAIQPQQPVYSVVQGLLSDRSRREPIQVDSKFPLY